VFDTAAIGASRLGGAFTYDPRPVRPLLSGRLTGSKLLLADLGPAVGAPAQMSPAVPDAALADSNPKRANARPGRVLPDREFDLPSLRAMDANVLVSIDNLDLGSSVLEPIKPLRTHLVLTDGVLSLRELEARTAQGRVFGNVQLDGRSTLARWTADLRWAGVRLESFIHQKRGGDAPPYVAGRLNGQARVEGQGKSTAAILGSLGGGVRTQLLGGTVSHLAVEAAGLDIAQGLGMLVKGDDALKVQCTVADFAVAKGVLTPRVFVLDTPDSTLMIDGSVSLASEALDLRVRAAPKDFSPLALRTPVRVRGSFADPSISLEPGRLAGRVGAAALLSFINPLAALLPFIDLGEGEDAARGTDACKALSQRIAAKPSLAAPTRR
jgi:AsmA family protein